jgi:hypothetical protein
MNRERAIDDLYWYLKEMCAATKTLAKSGVAKTPLCLPHAESAIRRFELFNKKEGEK